MAVKKIIFLLLSVTVSGCGQTENPVSEIRHQTESGIAKSYLSDGSIVFQNSQSAQCKAIELATHSPYTHCGIIFHKENKCFVLEAVQPVKYTLLDDWTERGKNKHYIIKRMKDTTFLDKTAILKMMACGEKYIGKDYDLYFGWSDERIYCSELVWKIYKEVLGTEIGKLKQLKDFDLSSKEGKKNMKERYGKNIPYEEKVISPADIFNSELLETAFEN